MLNSDPLKKNIVLKMLGIVKDFPGVRALDQVSFDLRKGEVHALVGENGAGKSTLMKILGSVYPHGSFQGNIILDGKPAVFHSIRDSEKAGIALIHQELNLVENMTVAENIFLGDELVRKGTIDRYGMIQSAQDLLDAFGFEIDARSEISELGIGNRQLVEIAKALRKQSRILILDEPTAALSNAEIELLFKQLKSLCKQGAAMVYISHKLEEVVQIANRITVLRDGRSVGTGDVDQWTRNSIINAMVGRELSALFPAIPSYKGKLLLELKNVNVADPKNAHKKYLSNISLRLYRGEILGIAGLMGSGRTEILSTIFGNPPGVKTDGFVLAEGKEIKSSFDAVFNGISFVPEDRKNQGLVLHGSILDNISLVHWDKFTRFGVVDINMARKESESVCKQLNIRAASLDYNVDYLSGGNQQKVVFGKWLLREPKILLLDEPTRGIDVGAKAEIFKLINEFKNRGMGIIFVSSELPEIIGMCDRVIVVKKGAIVGEVKKEDLTQEKIMGLAV